MTFCIVHIFPYYRCADDELKQRQHERERYNATVRKQVTTMTNLKFLKQFTRFSELAM